MSFSWDSPEQQTTFGLINDGWDLFSVKAIQAFDQAMNFAGDLGDFPIDSVSYDTTFAVPSGNGLVWNPPDKPDEPDLEGPRISMPSPLEIDIPDIPEFGSAPEFTGEAPPLDFSGMPNMPNFGNVPGAPSLDPVNLPSVPQLVFPEPPTLADLNLPSAPELTEHQFQGVRPEFSDNPPDAAIEFVEEAYESQLLDQVRGEIIRMLETGTGMPAVVEQMLVDRLRQRNDRSAVRAVQEAMEETSARGFFFPQGHTLRRVQEARQNNQNQNAEASRDVFVQRRTEEIQNFQFAVAQGIALENILIQKHLNVMQRSFDLARAVVDLKYRRFEAAISVYATALQGYQADAAVYETLIRAEAQKLEQYRLEIQAEALKQEVDRNKVQIYTARLEALQQRVNIYTAQVDAAKTIAETNNIRIRGYLGEIQGFRARIDARIAEFDAWRTKVQGQLGKVQAYEAETRAFMAEVQAYDTRVRSLSQKPALEFQQQELKVRGYLAELETARTEHGAEATRLQSETSVYGSKAQMYAADGQMATNETAARDRNFQTALEARRVQSERLFAQAQLDVEQVLRTAQILAQALDSAGRVSSQLSAGAMSAVSLGANAGVSYSRSLSETRNLTSPSGPSDPPPSDDD